MKKLLKLSAVALLLITFVSCYTNKQKESENDSKKIVYSDAVRVTESEDILKDIAYFDESEENRYIATKKINNESYLKYIAYFDSSDKVRRLATSKITTDSILLFIAKFDKDENIRKLAMERLHTVTK